MTLPTKPATYTNIDLSYFNRKEPIRADRLQDMIQAGNFLVGNRTRCLFNRSYMQKFDTANIDSADTFSAATQKTLCNRFQVYTRSKITWLRFRTIGISCEIQLDLDASSGLGSVRTWTHTHGAAGGSGEPNLSTTYIAIEADTYYWGSLYIDGSAVAEPWAISIHEVELTPSDLSMLVPTYDNIAAADSDLSPTQGYICCIRDYLMSYYPGDWIYSGANGIWVPYDFRDALLVEAYRGGIAGGVGVNANWTDNTTGTGAINFTPGSDRTDFDGSIAPADNAYIDATPSADFDPTLLYMRVKPLSGSAPLTADLLIDNGVDRARLSVNDGVVGDIDFYLRASPADYNISTNLTELLIEINSNKDRAKVWLYQTMELIQTVRYTDFPASTSRLLRWGDLSASAGQTYLEGNPAMVCLQGQID